MCYRAMILSPASAAMSEEHQHHISVGPLRTATGFVLGIALSGAFWVAAGFVAWYVV